MDAAATQTLRGLILRAERTSDKIRNIAVQGRRIKTEPTAAFLFKGMMREIKSHYDGFQQIYDNVLDLHIKSGTVDTFPSKTELELQEKTDRYYYECLAIIESLAEPISTSSSPPNLNQTLVNSSRMVRATLPPIKLHKFDGKMSNWPLFKDQFYSLVHMEDSIPPVEKFNLLISSLEGVALSLIKGLPITDATYQQAWDTLMEHYNSKRIMANYYLHQLLKCKPFSGKPTLPALKRFITQVCENISAYRKLQVPNSEEFILFTLAVRCLDETTRHEFENYNTDEEFPTFTSLYKFIKSECKTRELCGMGYDDSSNSQSQQHSFSNYKGQSKKSFFVAEKQSKGANQSKGECKNSTKSNSSKTANHCPACKGILNHSLHRCFKFRDATPRERVDMLKNWGGCKNCLASYHTTRACPSEKTCRECEERHNSWLHIEDTIDRSVSSETSAVAHSSNKPTVPGSAALLGGPGPVTNECVLLGTVVALIQDANGGFKEVRMVLDSGSQFSFITEECASRLGLSQERFRGSISGIGRVALDRSNSKGMVDCVIRPTTDYNNLFSTKAVVLPHITSDLPQTAIPVSWRTKYAKFELADSQYWKPGPVEFLLGGDLFYDILEGTPIHVAPNMPKLTPTVFGFVVGGRFQRPVKQVPTASLFAFHNNELSKVIQRFWTVEEVEERRLSSPEDEYCEQQFLQTYSRSPSGRYIIALPFKEPPPDLSSSRALAATRFRNLETKFARNPDFKVAYIKFMDEYRDLNHMVVTEEPPAYAIPHHAVFRTDNGKPKIRVVFDASCKTMNGSLNDYLLPGPKLQRDIGMVILRFRRHKVVFSADIVKMFRQILIREQDLKYQHILWRSDPGEKLENYALLTVTYGTTSAPWGAIRTLIQLVADEGKCYPEASDVILNDTYVDDICTGSDSLEGALALKTQLIQLLGKGGFELSKWSSNHPGFLDQAQSSSRPLQLDIEDQTVKLLGLQWVPNRDVFTYNIDVPSLIFTKRSILSSIARIFDPLGYISPVVCCAKIILQSCWQAKVDWDENVPIPIANRWKAFVEELPILDKFAIPRYISTSHAQSRIIVGFCDASELAYSAMIYLCSSTYDGCQVSLLKAKAKLAPLKILTIPRLELSAALLLTRLYSSLTEYISSLAVNRCYWFSDSTVVLGWLNTEPSSLKTFVAHRVAEIIDVTNITDWYHVGTKENPSDCSSRGLSPSEFIKHSLWLSGPPWLLLPPSSWPAQLSATVLTDMALPELKDCSVSHMVLESSPSYFIQWMERFSSFGRIVRIMAYVLRFLRNRIGWPKGKLRANFSSQQDATLVLSNIPPISAAEHKASTITLIKIVQQHHFSPNIPATLLKLSPFITEEGVLRVGGRLRQSELPKDLVHPILLPGKCHFSRLLIDYHHLMYLHLGPSALQAILQNSFWITSARVIIRQRIHRCATCFKLSRDPQAPYMGDLPRCRFQEGRAFQEVGVDFAGPFYIKESLRRKAALGKAYLCLFICMTSKAVHLEVVSDCSTPAFLATLDRFLARRGLPTRIHSDCGSNFIGASRELRELYDWYQQQVTKTSIEEYLSAKTIEWSFNPPASPHFGGLWEAAVRSSKNIFKRISGSTPLTFEELSTLFARVEAILNSRPICPLSNDPESLECLTPGHLIIGASLTAPPELPLLELPENRLSRWQLVQQRTQHFWNRWRSEYLHHLQQRSKWTRKTPNLEKGDLVILKANTPPTQWILGRVQELYPGKDGTVRVVEIKTPQGRLTRPVVKLVSLRPITDPEPPLSSP